MKHSYRIVYLLALLVMTILLPNPAKARLITARDFTSEHIPNLQSQVNNTLLLDRDGFIWISNSNGIDRYDGKNTVHYKIGDKSKRGYRDGMMNLMHRDHKGVIWSFTERGLVYKFDKVEDQFKQVLDLYANEIYCSVQALFTADNDMLILGTNEGIVCYDMNSKKVVSHVVKDCNIRCMTMQGKDKLLIGSDKGMLIYDLEKKVNEEGMLNDLPVICMEPVGKNLWIGTRGKGLYVMPRNNPYELKLVEGADGLIINGLAYAENYGLLIGSDGKGLIQMDLDIETGIPTTELHPIAYDNPKALFPTKSAGINDVMVNQGNVWFTMHMGGCTRLIPNHNMVTLANPVAESPSDNFVHDLDTDAEGHLWVAFNQTLIRFDDNGKNPKTFMDHEARFLTMKVRNDGTIWAGGYGTGLYHIYPETGEREWYPSISDQPVNDCIYDIHDSPDGDLWLGGLNFPLTRLHFLPDGTFEKTKYPEMQQVWDVESLNNDTLVLGTSDGIWLLDTRTGESSHRFLVGEDEEWKGTNLVRALTIRNGREVWIATAGAGLVCYDVPTDHYDYYDNLDVLPSLELRSVLILNDSICCASTEKNGVFSFNCNTRRTERALLQEDVILQQEFLQNSGIRMPSGNLLFGGDRGGVVLTAKDLIEGLRKYEIFIIGPQVENNTYSIGYRHNNFVAQFCTNDIYHQNDYRYEYRVDGWSDDWRPTDGPGELHLLNIPPGEWTVEIRATNSSGMVIDTNVYLEVNRPIWQRWYAWVAYVFIFIYILIKIVVFQLRPRIEDM